MKEIEKFRQLQKERNETLQDWKKIYADWSPPDDMPIEQIEEKQNRYRMQTEYMLESFGEYLDKHGNVYLQALDTKGDLRFMQKIEQDRALLLEEISQENQRCMSLLDELRSQLQGEHQTFKKEVKDTKGYANRHIEDAHFVDKKI